MKIYLLWALKIVMAEVILTALQAPLKKRNLKTPARVALIIGKFLLAVAFAALVLAGPVVLRPVQPIMLALYVALVADSLADACCTVFYAVKKRERKFSVVKITSIVFCLIFAVYGTVNMEIVTPAYREYSSPKIKREHKIVFIADIHTGSPQDFGVIEKTVKKIKAEKPEFVILGGDIVDDYTTATTTVRRTSSTPTACSSLPRNLKTRFTETELSFSKTSFTKSRAISSCSAGRIRAWTPASISILSTSR